MVSMSMWVVGGFVHQQHIRLRKHQFAVDHAALLAAGKNLHGFLGLVSRKQQPAQSRAHQLIVVRLAGVSRHPREEVAFFLELGLRVLRHVAGQGVLNPGDAARGGPQFTRETAHQRGLAGAIRSDDGDPLACLDVERDIVEHRRVRFWIAETQVFHGHRRAVQLLALLEPDVRVPAAMTA